MSYGFEEWYSSEQRKLSIHIDSNQTLISQTASSIEEGLRLHDDKKVLNHNYKVMKKLDNALQDINFADEIEKLQEAQKKLNKLELLNEYSSLGEVPTFDPITISIPSYDSIITAISNKVDDKVNLDSIDKEKIYKIDAGAFTVFKGHLTDKQWQTFTHYFNYEIADEFCEITVNYDAFKLLLLNDPMALDEVWGYFDEIGIEGIHRLDDVQKLPSGWETAGKYIAVGSYVIDFHTFTDGIVNNDWGKVCSVPASWGGSAITGAIIGSIEVFTPVKWIEIILIIFGGVGAGKAGNTACNNIQEEATKYNDDIRLHLDEGDSLLEARVKAMGNYIKYPEGTL